MLKYLGETHSFSLDPLCDLDRFLVDGPGFNKNKTFH